MPHKMTVSLKFLFPVCRAQTNICIRKYLNTIFDIQITLYNIQKNLRSYINAFNLCVEVTCCTP